MHGGSIVSWFLEVRENILRCMARVEHDHDIAVMGIRAVLSSGEVCCVMVTAW